MGDYFGAASSVLSISERRVEVSAQNISNMMTPGYRRRISFEQVMAGEGDVPPNVPSAQVATDFTPGKLNITDNPLDIAISGDGFFVVRGDEQAQYTRNGQFKRDADGRIVTQKGLPVQLQGGGDITVKSGNFSIQPDGSISEDGTAIGKIAVVDFTDKNAVTETQDGMFAAADGNVTVLESPQVRQGALEASNVTLGDEMVAIMQTLRSAGGGQKLVSLYDDLLGRAISSFGQN